MAWPLILAGAAVGKHFLVDQPEASRQRKLQATTARFSPWTGLSPQNVQNPNLLGDVLTYGGAGLGMQQNAAQAASQEQMNQNFLKYLEQQGQPQTLPTQSTGLNPANSNALIAMRSNPWRQYG